VVLFEGVCSVHDDDGVMVSLFGMSRVHLLDSS
jgi:hypothetical protein